MLLNPARFIQTVTVLRATVQEKKKKQEKANRDIFAARGF